MTKDHYFYRPDEIAEWLHISKNNFNDLRSAHDLMEEFKDAEIPAHSEHKVNPWPGNLGDAVVSRIYRISKQIEL